MSQVEHGQRTQEVFRRTAKTSGTEQEVQEEQEMEELEGEGRSREVSAPLPSAFFPGRATKIDKRAAPRRTAGKAGNQRETMGGRERGAGGGGVTNRPITVGIIKWSCTIPNLHAPGARQEEKRKAGCGELRQRRCGRLQHKTLLPAHSWDRRGWWCSPFRLTNQVLIVQRQLRHQKLGSESLS